MKSQQNLCLKKDDPSRCAEKSAEILWGPSQCAEKSAEIL